MSYNSLRDFRNFLCPQKEERTLLRSFRGEDRNFSGLLSSARLAAVRSDEGASTAAPTVVSQLRVPRHVLLSCILRASQRPTCTCQLASHEDKAVMVQRSIGANVLSYIPPLVNMTGMIQYVQFFFYKILCVSVCLFVVSNSC